MSATPSHIPAPVFCPASARQGPGRPREYDPDRALGAVLGVFKARGYEAASLEDLTAAAGLSRSSFYAAFGSKRGALLAALDLYLEAGETALDRAAAADPEAGPRDAIRRVVDTMFAADVHRAGCFVVDMSAELGARDIEAAGKINDSIARKARFLAGLAAPLVGEAAAEGRARAALALYLGAAAMRKAGAPVTDVDALKTEACRLLGVD
ncbi:MAG: helix-turn-helix domain-containing protein [Pseudomonadota bacterium]|nr:helix-turn-helix domain-containing protein [Pseudomonadota bacterium]MEE3100230.1 helix-turn-helix domain-containing protein [Pseudomonadota bacterium]